MYNKKENFKKQIAEHLAQYQLNKFFHYASVKDDIYKKGQYERFLIIGELIRSQEKEKVKHVKYGARKGFYLIDKKDIYLNGDDSNEWLQEANAAPRLKELCNKYGITIETFAGFTADRIILMGHFKMKQSKYIRKDDPYFLINPDAVEKFKYIYEPTEQTKAQ